MSTSPETFSKVKNLLRKMDQSIDSARSRRLTPPAVPPAPAPMNANPQAPTPPSHSIQAAAAASNAPIRARAMARPILQQRPAI
ncbi:MAG: hypothetical protein JNK58_00065 [Phycisphaerae bacterium]|nr:hypothetical protein [Phycisphaerae bacterium]